ncbi:hypothetical protein B296_00030369 [Ensete ventricosum]|uniref:Uncharacterized protein n=1 Tax=Ensete ventricosum TaxID=4639 RepID=A0A426XI94_ENSVE|nr:hypothetical protein B296_00030369 [Ensete ventricosum]
MQLGVGGGASRSDRKPCDPKMSVAPHMSDNITGAGAAAGAGGRTAREACGSSRSRPCCCCGLGYCLPWSKWLVAGAKKKETEVTRSSDAKEKRCFKCSHTQDLMDGTR